MKLLPLITLMISAMATANVHLPSIFSDNMVLQRNSEVTVWGSADPKEKITLKADFLDKEYKTVAGNDATFRITFKTPKEGGPYKIRIKGYNDIVLSNVMLGEVWLMSGQSNMEMSAAWGIDNGDVEISKATHPEIRLFMVSKAASEGVQRDAYDQYGGWKSSTPETMKSFSAIGYFFAQRLQEELKVPVGVICAAWGGSAAELWTPQEVFKARPEFTENYKKLGSSEYYPSLAGGAYNAMIAPFNDFKIAGAAWYQGETNTGNPDLYAPLLTDMIASWRKARGYEFPFYIIQIAPYGSWQDSGAKIRNAQRYVALNVPNSGLVLTADVSEADNLHPKNKKPVGIRLANLALTDSYHKNLGLVKSPVWKSSEFRDGKVILNLENAEGLYFKNGISKQFEIAAADGKFVVAQASIKNNQIVLQAKNIRNPVYVRYAWSSVAMPDLFNKAHLPASTYYSSGNTK